MLNTKINNMYIFYTINNLLPTYIRFLTLTYVIHGLHVWFSCYRIQLLQLLIHISLHISSQVMGLEIFYTVVGGYIILMVQVCLLCMTEWIHILCLMCCKDRIYTWWTTHSNFLLLDNIRLRVIMCKYSRVL